MTDKFERLRAVVKPPVPVSGFPEWGELERRVGGALPPDYRLLVDGYGPGVFDDFLHVLQPKSKFPPIRLVSFSGAYRERLSAQIASGRVLPHDPDILLPVARTEDGDVISWVMVPADSPAHWSLTINNSSREEWLEFPGGIVDFLFAVYVEDLRMPFFPDDFPSPERVFSAHPSVEELTDVLRRMNDQS
ncbi:hypothetical protein [Actinoplanes derwentensis]|uniref:SMI1-KNR4 cell-wall n=1 Tax=Actinoplanes derwentensis TaxID=113562 RepID=A0A1H1YQC2_9ACTN|nr:hypothetical protein [Actinoplanes derwentensis]GID81242.1 hypothetical protein Ade03nite_01660 [Actinoplanes derwentensis]SDT23597.1 hypothetical protein SAMN04489716_2951 [Actinoplanes derwentensis]